MSHLPIDGSHSLLSLLDVLTCPEVGESQIRRLAKTQKIQDELRALVSLWQSLGHPTSALWRYTYVDYNRIVDAQEEKK